MSMYWRPYRSASTRTRRPCASVARRPNRYRDGAARARLQSHPRDEYSGHSAADGRDPSIVKVEKWLVYRLAQFKPLLAKRFETTKTHSRRRIKALLVRQCPEAADDRRAEHVRSARVD